ncbi:MAG TPA: imelysin family protein [Micropepsaceae bacterium]|nr:imelysin family protein [Micropepsaceae bacterium]
MRAFFGIFLAGALISGPAFAASVAQPKAADVLNTYSDLAHAMYEDSFLTAKALQTAVNAFLADPTPVKLAAARNAWKAARVPYLQTEGFRFGNTIVDEWEGEVNSWPLDEGLIDYVAASYGKTSDENPLYTLNLIANKQIRVGAKQLNASVIDKALLRQLQHAQGVEANVATGYHAIEFLLWGQDLHGTGPGAGERPASDYDVKACTHGNCDRRGQYLKAATDLLAEDMGTMAANWAADGKARKDFAAKGQNGGLSTILTGIGSLSYGEMAGERMKLGLILHDPEEEQDCFSDNTHNSHYYDQLGITEIWGGRYTRTNGAVVQGPSFRDYVAAKNPEVAKRMDQKLADTLAKVKKIKDTGDSGKMAYDQMIAKGNTAGNKMVQDAIDALIAQTRADEAVVAAMGLKISLEGSDSLDNPSSVTR